LYRYPLIVLPHGEPVEGQRLEEWAAKEEEFFGEAELPIVYHPLPDIQVKGDHLGDCGQPIARALFLCCLGEVGQFGEAALFFMEVKPWPDRIGGGQQVATTEAVLVDEAGELGGLPALQLSALQGALGVDPATVIAGFEKIAGPGVLLADDFDQFAASRFDTVAQWRKNGLPRADGDQVGLELEVVAAWLSVIACGEQGKVVRMQGGATLGATGAAALAGGGMRH